MKSILQITVKEFQYAQLSKPGGKFVIAICGILNILVAITMINSAVEGSWNDVFSCFKVIVLFIIPWLIERNLKMKLAPMLFITVQLFIYASIILGEIHAFYVKLPFWDTMLHTLNGFLFSAIGFVLINLICKKNQYNKFSFKPVYLIFVTFCFSMTVGVVWEFYEFIMDNLFNRDMQKDTIIHTIKSMKINENAHLVTVYNSITNVTVNGQNLELGGYLDIGLYDTMSDLFNNFVGALLFCFIKYFDNRKGAIELPPRYNDINESPKEFIYK